METDCERGHSTCRSKKQIGQVGRVQKIYLKSQFSGTARYSVTVRDTSHLEPAAAFQYVVPVDDPASEQHFREMDVRGHGGSG